MREPIEDMREPIEAVREPIEAVREPIEAMRESIEAVREPIEAVREPIDAIRDWRNYPVGRNWSAPDSCCHLESPGCGVSLFLSSLSNCPLFTVLRTGGTTLWA